MDKRFRELEEDENHGWSDWIWAMAPSKKKHQATKRDSGQVGYRNAELLTNLEDYYEGGCGPCGIYEFGATRRDEGDAHRAVVYVGSTCPRTWFERWMSLSCPKMSDRIVDYTKHGNHKAEEINYALKRGCTLWVRFKPTKDKEKAMDMEDKLLSRYDYAWNERKNGVRPILSVADMWLRKR